MSPKYTMAQVFERFGNEYLASRKVNTDQLKLIYNIKQCKTAALGGHYNSCTQCGIISRHYNSCGNRNCTMCGGVKKEKWILQRKYDLLPVKYFHTVFTLPSELRAICLYNQKVLFDLLFKAAWNTMQAFGNDPKWKMEAKMGMIAILHTWTQQLMYHPHIHCIVPSGGINAQGVWKTSKGSEDYLFKVELLSKVFRGKFMEVFKSLLLSGKLKLPPKINTLQKRKDKQNLIDTLYTKEWVVYSKPCFAGPNQVLEYLGRYSHRIAISNHRILDIKEDKITFKYLDRNDNNKNKITSLHPHRFISRFLLHVLPKGYTKIRHYGFLSSRAKTTQIERIREAFKLPQRNQKPCYTIKDVLKATLGLDVDKCRHCGGTVVEWKKIPKPNPIRGPSLHYEN